MQFKMQKRVLVITYYWPPSGGAGVQRWLKFVKYLRNYGWEPVIYTPLNPEFPAIDPTLENDIPDGIEIIKTPIWEPYQLYKKIAGVGKDEKVNASGFISEKKSPGLTKKLSIWIRGNFFIPDARRFWIKPSVKFLNNWLSQNKVDAIVSTGPPHSMHLIALGIKKRHHIPWIADFRDPWTNIDFYKELNLTSIADNIHHRQELSVLTEADEIVVIGDSMKADFQKIKNREYAVITNGFDNADTDEIVAQPDNKFTIAHIGSMAKSRNPVALWKALAELKTEIPDFGEELVIKLAGTVDYSVLDEINNNGLSGNLEKIEYLPHNQIIRLQKESRVLLLIINNTPNAKVILPGKFFEYMASGRPILCIGPQDGDSAKIIKETRCGVVTDFDSVIEIKEKLRILYKNYKENTDSISNDKIAKYSRVALTGEMAKLLDKAVIM